VRKKRRNIQTDIKMAVKQSIKKITIAALAMIFGVLSCKKDNAEDMYPIPKGNDCDTTDVRFSTMVKPVIDSKCANTGCHKGTVFTGLDLTTYTAVAEIAHNGKLVGAISHDGSTPFMPKGLPKLDDCTIAKISKWVRDGARNN
jgi:hypothetical protein